jgi:hypothetical protein
MTKAVPARIGVSSRIAVARTGADSGVAASLGLALRCRPITSADLDAVVALLKKGFGRQRSRRFWQRMLTALGNRPIPEGMPRYGYLLEARSRPVGVLLALSSTIHSGTTTFTRCNLSSWYVEPEFRPYGSLLSSRTLRHKEVTCTNISPAPQTWPLVAGEARGLFTGADRSGA